MDDKQLFDLHFVNCVIIAVDYIIQPKTCTAIFKLLLCFKVENGMR
jgi:hypothetical protein